MSLVEFVQVNICLILFWFTVGWNKGTLYPYCFKFCSCICSRENSRESWGSRIEWPKLGTCLCWRC